MEVLGDVFCAWSMIPFSFISIGLYGQRYLLIR